MGVPAFANAEAEGTCASGQHSSSASVSAAAAANLRKAGQHQAAAGLTSFLAVHVRTQHRPMSTHVDPCAHAVRVCTRLVGLGRLAALTHHGRVLDGIQVHRPLISQKVEHVAGLLGSLACTPGRKGGRAQRADAWLTALVASRGSVSGAWARLMRWPVVGATRRSPIAACRLPPRPRPHPPRCLQPKMRSIQECRCCDTWSLSKASRITRTNSSAAGGEVGWVGGWWWWWCVCVCGGGPLGRVAVRLHTPG